LLYPAERAAFIERELIIPPPEDLFIPVGATNEASFLHAWLFKATSTSKRKGLVVHFHGNGQNLTTHFMFFRWITEFNYDYLIFDYRGYGSSSDERASPEKTVQDGLAVFDFVDKKFPSVPIIAIGQSLGSNVLQRTLQERNRNRASLPKLVVFDSSFLSYQEAGSSVFGQRWFLYPLKPLAYLTINDTWSASKAKDQSPSMTPALFFHGDQDQSINISLGQKNFENWKGPKLFLIQEGGFHTAAFGDPRFIKNRPVLLSCIESALNPLRPFADCAQMNK
jgi:pimeloyl-ACP methyl ester carboxylesterase